MYVYVSFDLPPGTLSLDFICLAVSQDSSRVTVTKEQLSLKACEMGTFEIFYNIALLSIGSLSEMRAAS